MAATQSSPATSVKTFKDVKGAVANLKAGGPGSKVRLAGDFKSNKRVNAYFRRQGCNVTVVEEPDGSRLITYNSPSPSGRESRRAQKRRYGKSHRPEEEPPIGEKLDGLNRDLDIGEQIFVRGHETNIRDCLRNNFPEWNCEVSKTGDGWTIVRKG
jgi:hypothetical protein